MEATLAPHGVRPIVLPETRWEKRVKRWLAILIIYVMCFGIVTFLRMTQPPKDPEHRLKTTEAAAEDLSVERSFHVRANRASSPRVTAPVVTSTLPPASTTQTTTAPSPKPIRTVSSTIPPTPPRPQGDIWAALARCESSMNQRATSKTNPPYLGYFQFSMATWQSVGGPGDPRDQSYEVQLQYAQKLQARSGWGQWPRCSQKLGLR